MVAEYFANENDVVDRRVAAAALRKSASTADTDKRTGNIDLNLHNRQVIHSGRQQYIYKGTFTHAVIGQRFHSLERRINYRPCSGSADSVSQAELAGPVVAGGLLCGKEYSLAACGIKGYMPSR
jgi:hypothetical protein